MNSRVLSTVPESRKVVQRHHEASASLVLRGMLLNGFLAVIKLSAGVLGHTYALIADGVESLLDVLTSLLVWVGFKVAERPPDDNHPYGHGKAESLAAWAVTLFIFAAAGWIAWHAVVGIVSPSQPPHAATLLVLIFVVGIKFWFSRRMAEAGRKAGSTALGVEAMHHYADALTSIAAFIGISIALLGGEGYESADDWAALFACLIIVINGALLLARAVGDVMDVAVSEEFTRGVRNLALGIPEVVEIDKCRVRKSGLSHLVDIHVRVNGDLTVRVGHDIAHKVKDALMASDSHAITDVVVHIEPVG